MRVLSIFTLVLSVMAISFAQDANSESGNGSDIGDVIVSGSGSGNDLIGNDSMSGSGNDSMADTKGSFADDDCGRLHGHNGHGKNDSMRGSMDSSDDKWSHCVNKIGSDSGNNNQTDSSKQKTNVPSKKSNANIPSYKTTVLSASMVLGVVYLIV